MVRIGWDWYQHGGNKRKHNQRDKPDSQSHWMSEYRNLGCERIRSKYGEKIKQYIENIKEDEELAEFCKELQKLGTQAGSGHMVRLGFYGTQDLDILSMNFPRNLIFFFFK